MVYKSATVYNYGVIILVPFRGTDLKSKIQQDSNLLRLKPKLGKKKFHGPEGTTTCMGNNLGAFRHKSKLLYLKVIKRNWDGLVMI